MALALLNGVGACTIDNSDPGVTGMCLADDGVTSIPCSLIRECDGTQASTNQHFEYQIGQSTGNVNINVVDPKTGEILGHEDANSNFVPGVAINNLPAVGYKEPVTVVNENRASSVSPQFSYDPITRIMIPASTSTGIDHINDCGGGPVYKYGGKYHCEPQNASTPNGANGLSVYKWAGGYWTMPEPKEYRDNPANFLSVNAVSTDSNNPRTSYSIPQAVILNTNTATTKVDVPTTNVNAGSDGDDWITTLLKKFSPTTQLRTNMPSVANRPNATVAGVSINPTYAAIGIVGLIGLYVYSQSGMTRGRY